MKTITTVMQCTNLGGMEQATMELLRLLIAQGYRCQVLSLNPIGGLKAEFDQLGIRYLDARYAGKGGILSTHEILLALRKLKGDAVLQVGHNLLASMLISGCPKRHRALWIHYHHEGVLSARKWRLLYGIALRKFGRIIFPTQFIMDEAVKLLPAIEAHSVHIPYAFTIPPTASVQDREQAKARLGLSPTDVVVGNAGWLIQRKRFDVFIDVAHRILKQRPEIKFLVSGDGPLKDELRSRCDSLGIAQRFTWLGWQSNLSDFYKAIDLLLFNSDFDALGRTPLEAMSYKVPVVASVLRGGLKEVITLPQHGILFESHDVQALSEAALDLLASAQNIQAMGNSALLRVNEYGNPSNHVARMLEAIGLS